MNKKELAASLAKKVGLSQAKAMDVLNAIFDGDPDTGIISSELNNGHKVTIPGFGTFATKERAARTGTNPSSGKKIRLDRGGRRRPDRWSARRPRPAPDQPFEMFSRRVLPGLKNV